MLQCAQIELGFREKTILFSFVASSQELVVVTGRFPVVAAAAFDDCFVLLSAIAPVLL